MIKRLLLTASLTISSTFAYNVGDTVDKNIVNDLKMNDNKIYIVDFFASWCASCKIELPLISKLNQTLDKSKYVLLGVNSDTNINKGKEFVNKLQLSFDVVYDNQNKIISKFNPIGVPAIYYIKNSKVQKVVFGAVHNIDQKILNDLKTIGE
ncbi:TlpA family protein disulfide reductase [Arcobacteraceae bacterium]|nr:TlpA family protein disulfide reductase [Arcobacteraceae bacterium]